MSITITDEGREFLASVVKLLAEKYSAMYTVDDLLAAKRVFCDEDSFCINLPQVLVKLTKGLHWTGDYDQEAK